MRAGALEHRSAERGIGAAVREDTRAHGGEFARFVAGGRELHLHGVPFRVDLQAVRAGEAHLDWLFQQIAGERRVMLNAHVLLAAKPAANHHGGDAHLFRRQSQHGGAFLARLIHALIAAIDVHAVALDFGNRALRLQKRVIRKRDTVMVGHHVRAGANHLVRIATLDALIGKQVVLAIRMDEFEAVLSRVVCGKDGGERFVFHLYGGFARV